MKFTEEQQTVIEHRGSPLRVVAGPGTGKTACLTRRIGDLILRDGVLPSRILSLTFTKASTGDMIRKLEDLGVKSDTLPEVRTLHSKAVGLIRLYGTVVGISSNARPMTDNQARMIIEDCLEDLQAEGVKLSFQGPGNIGSYKKAYQSEISGGHIYPELDTAIRAKFCTAYEKLQQFYAAIDWYAVVPRAIEILKSDATTLENEQNRYDHVLVDEFQDLNPVDQELVRLLVGKSLDGLCIVGDEDQSIYETQRFASPLGFVKLEDTVPGLSTLSLTLCHRCPKEVLVRANLLIAHNQVRVKGKLELKPFDSGRRGGVATFYQKSKKRESVWLAEKIVELKNKGFDYRDFMVLFSEGKIANDYVTELEKAGVPLDVKLKRTGLFDSECFAMVWSFLNLMADPDNLNVRESLGYWPDIGRKTIHQLRLLSGTLKNSLWNAVLEVGGNPDKYGFIRQRKPLLRFYEGVKSLLKVEEFNQVIPNVLKFVPTVCASDAGVKTLEEYFVRQVGKEALMKLADILTNFEAERDQGRFETTSSELPNKVRIMTLHSAKGLEAEIVFVPALEEDIMPGMSSNIEERRRLFYVSVTRAKQFLLLSWASQRTGPEIHRQGGMRIGKKPSRFLAEMNE